MAKSTHPADHSHEPFVLAALAVALTAGFGYGAYLVASLALGVIPGSWFGALVQAHGHAQLFGWVGLFVLGMGLYFLPRLRGVRLKHRERAPWALALLLVGLLLRALGQPLAAGLAPGPAADIARGFVLASALSELAGVAVLASSLLATERGGGAVPPGSPAFPVARFAILAFASLALALLLNLFGVLNALGDGRTVLAPRYDQTIIMLVLYGVALPMAIIFSMRNLPLFIRLALPPRTPWRLLALVYAAALLLRLAPNLLAILDDAIAWTGTALRANYVGLLVFDALAVAGVLVLNACLIYYLWQLDLIRRREPWTVQRAPNTRPDLDHLRKPTRANYPDSGEYGRFELLIYSAYLWLVVAIALDVLRAVGGLTERFDVPQDVARHALMVGFLTLLILGMAVRMFPGFSGKRGLADPGLVFPLFILGNLAALLRVVPALFPDSALALSLWGLSGTIGWLAVLLLAIILVRTLRRP